MREHGYHGEHRRHAHHAHAPADNLPAPKPTHRRRRYTRTVDYGWIRFTSVTEGRAGCAPYALMEKTWMPRASEVSMSAPFDNEQAFIWLAPGLPVEELLAAKGTQPLASVDDLAADTFSSDAELEEFLAFTAAERHRDLA